MKSGCFWKLLWNWCSYPTALGTLGWLGDAGLLCFPVDAEDSLLGDAVRCLGLVHTSTGKAPPGQSSASPAPWPGQPSRLLPELLERKRLPSLCWCPPPSRFRPDLTPWEPLGVGSCRAFKEKEQTMGWALGPACEMRSHGGGMVTGETGALLRCPRAL